jgi:NhaA family Na+:H+ antiporter
MTFASILDPLTLGIILGLLIGKPVGIFLLLVLAIKLRLSPMPHNATWTQLFGLSILCGIGFTMSLFIGGLAFEGIDKQAAIRLGVLIGSVIAATVGYCLLRYGPSSEETQEEEKFIKRMVQQVDFAFPTKER